MPEGPPALKAKILECKNLIRRIYGVVMIRADTSPSQSKIPPERWTCFIFDIYRGVIYVLPGCKNPDYEASTRSSEELSYPQHWQDGLPIVLVAILSLTFPE